jgi:hypothetical protein
MGYICIERMIGDKKIRSSFLGYNIDTDLPFREQNFDLWVEGFFYHFKKKKKNSEDTTMLPRGENMHVLRGFTVFSFY